jgi:hypothetical protein
MGHLSVILKWKILLHFHIFIGIGDLLSQDLNDLFLVFCVLKNILCEGHDFE